MPIRKILLGLALVGLVPTLALAQVNTVPQVGVITALNTQKQTFSTATVALPPAASATDIACIAGSTTKTVKVRKVSLSGTAGTLVTTPVYLIKRSVADTGGTAATTTADWATNVVAHDSVNATATATVIAYAANPTVGAAAGYLATGAVTFPVTSAGVATVPWVADYTTDTLYVQPPTLRGAAQQICINLGGVSVSSGLLAASIIWTEE